jgi:signal transduction histidine kinase
MSTPLSSQYQDDKNILKNSVFNHEAFEAIQKKNLSSSDNKKDVLSQEFKENFKLLIKRNKLTIFFMIVSFFICVTSFSYLIVSDFHKGSSYQRYNINYHFQNDFHNLLTTIENMESKNFLKKNFKKLSSQYDFIDAYYVVKKSSVIRHQKNNFSDNKSPEISELEISKKTNLQKKYNFYANDLAQKIKMIVSQNRFFYKGFYYFPEIDKKSIYYIYLEDDNVLSLLHLDVKKLISRYETKDISLEFVTQIQEIPEDVFSFNYVKNINGIEIEYKELLFFYIGIIIPYFVIFASFFMAIKLSIYVYSSHIQISKRIKELDHERDLLLKDTLSHNNRIKQLTESTNLVPWAATQNDNKFTFIGPQIEEFTGLSVDTWITAGFWLSHVHPEDRDIFFKALNDLKIYPYSTAEYRIYNNKGEIMWLRNTIARSYYQADKDDDEQKNEQNSYSYHGFITDITAQKRVLETLELARLAAEKASRMKSNFLASMSHELRTPLNSIIGFADIIKSLQKQYDKQSTHTMIAEYSDNILLSGKHLLDLINDILDYSKIEAGEFEIRIEPTSITDIFIACQMLLQNRADSAGISLIVKPPLETIYINVDPVRIKQVLINLLTNAIKFNRPDGKAALTFSYSENNDFVFKVTDTGIGMKPEDLRVALEKFRQIDDAKNRHQEGTGLGLPISKSLIELHGGVLDLNSIYGKGTQITITLPSSIIYQADACDDDSQKFA